MSPALRPSLSQIKVNIRPPSLLKRYGDGFMSFFALAQIECQRLDVWFCFCPLPQIYVHKSSANQHKT